MDGEYGTKAKLEDKLRGSAAPPTLGITGNANGNKGSIAAGGGGIGTSYLNPNTNTGSNGLMEKNYREKANQDRFQEMGNELEKYKEARKKVKLDSMNQEAKYMEE